MHEPLLPELSFSSVKFGSREIPWNLRPLLYDGGAQLHARDAVSMCEAGNLGRPLYARIELVTQIREALLNFLEGGGRKLTVRSLLDKLRHFFRWVDDNGGHALSLENVELFYQNWCDFLVHRARVGRDIKPKTAYEYGSGVGWVLDKVLERERQILKTTRLRLPRPSSRVVSAEADKQNLEETFAFGHLLLDLADGLSVEAIWGPLPLLITLRNGKVLEEWSGLKRSGTLKSPNPNWPPQAKQALQRRSENRASWQSEKSFRTRYALINMRIMAEMFMLMGQPGVNLAQAHKLRMDQWRYKPSSHGYEIRTYKHRRWGPVVFEIYSEYRAVFERYLRWRNAIFPSDPDGLLFPFLGKGGTVTQRLSDTSPRFGQLRKLCHRAGVVFVSPRTLRSTNVNWMLRRTGDPDITADEKQHTKQTLLGVYEKPSLQRAMVEVHFFWAKYDTTLESPGPGVCTGSTPEPIPGISIPASPPDCSTPSGCLFCAHQRDVDSEDHVWSLASFRLLKSFEEVELRSNIDPTPAQAAINRITDKLDFIKSSSSERATWVREAMLRLEEGRYHPAWKDLIESLSTNSGSHCEN